jgi:sigma-B regulation protein RsbU (phosphoserine phosphatase)
MTDLRAGQVIVVGTDGLWESRNEAGEQFGRERLRHAIRDLAGLDAKAIENGLYDRLKAFCGGKAIDDDITYVVVKITEEIDQINPGAEI